MLIISAGAGLGNQMFEYAFYLKLQTVYRDAVIKLDTQYAFPKAHNGYEVERIFDLKSEKATLEEVEKLADINYLDYFGRRDSFSSKIKRKLGIHKKSFVSQKDFTEYNDQFFGLDANKSYYLYGPFANSKYFEDIKDRVTEAFSFPEPDDKTRKIIERINNSESVSVHIRRGDYVSQGIELLGREYYDEAIARLTEITGNKKSDFTFYVFSDDMIEAKKIFNGLDNVCFIEGNTGDNSYRDMQLMSVCKHNIIINSTFGFWGAYLNRYRDKVVIGPKVPFAGFKYPFTCTGWIQI